MQDFIQRIAAYKYFREIAFLVAVLLLLGAWKFGIEGLAD